VQVIARLMGLPREDYADEHRAFDVRLAFRSPEALPVEFTPE
jgi:cytochrome P450